MLCIANLCTLAAFNIKLAIQVYYTQYVLNDVQFSVVDGLFSMGCILIGVFLVPGAVKRWQETGLSGRADAVGGGRRAELVWGTSSLPVRALSCRPFSAPLNSLNWALVPDTVDYGEWKTGIRAEGSAYTAILSRKISAAAGAGFLPGIMLTQIGYVPHAGERGHAAVASAYFLAVRPGDRCRRDHGAIL